jgi:hypothetical protein
MKSHSNLTCRILPIGSVITQLQSACRFTTFTFAAMRDALPMNKLLKLAVGIILVSTISACNRLGIEQRVSAADNFAKAHGFKKEMVQSNGFSLTAYTKVTDPNQPYNIYIEGDGLAFLNRYTISDNPTPSKIMMFKLASIDKRLNVIYLARPCQYTSIALNPKCSNSKYWSSDRFSEESVSAMNQAIIKLSHNKPTNLIGFSGGGAIAVLAAERNPKVSTIITVAGNLDHVAFNNHHRVSAMHNSINPIEHAAKVKHIPQLHLAGSKDDRVPASISEKYVSHSSSSCVKGEVIKGASHDSGWDKVWLNILAKPLNCN